MISALQKHIDSFVTAEFAKSLKTGERGISSEVVDHIKSKNGKVKGADIIELFNKHYPDLKITPDRNAGHHLKKCTQKSKDDKECKSYVCDESDELCKRHYNLSIAPKKEKKEEKAKNLCPQIVKSTGKPCNKKCEGEMCIVHLKSREAAEKKAVEEKVEKMPKATKDEKLKTYVFEHNEVKFSFDPKEQVVNGVVKDGKVVKLGKDHIKMLDEKGWKHASK